MFALPLAIALALAVVSDNPATASPPASTVSQAPSTPELPALVTERPGESMSLDVSLGFFKAGESRI